MTDPDALMAGMRQLKRKGGRPKHTGRNQRFSDALAQCERDGTDPARNDFLMTELARIALGPIDLGPMMPVIGRRVKEICDIAIDKGMEQ